MATFSRCGAIVCAAVYDVQKPIRLNLSANRVCESHREGGSDPHGGSRRFDPGLKPRLPLGQSRVAAITAITVGLRIRSWAYSKSNFNTSARQHISNSHPTRCRCVTPRWPAPLSSSHDTPWLVVSVQGRSHTPWSRTKRLRGLQVD